MLLSASWWCRNLVDYGIHRRPHDPSYAVLRRLPLGDGPIVDVGANMGQSARSIRLFARNEIVSFEINPSMRPHLQATSRIVRRHRYHLTGLGTHATDAVLLTPRFGRLRAHARASLSREHLERQRAALEARFGRDMDIDEQAVTIRRLDDFCLRPAFIKVDVEGFELEVLRGGERTLTTCHPPVLYEQLHGSDAARCYLESLGYRTFEVIDGAPVALERSGSTALNLVAIWSGAPRTGPGRSGDR